MDPFAGEVILIGEISVVIRNLELAGDLQPVAIDPILTGWHLQQHFS